MPTAERTIGYEVIDHNIVPDQYVTYIVDIWEGDRKDPATEVMRMIIVFRADDLETEELGAFDPDFTKVREPRSSYSRGFSSGYKPQPLLFELLETVKEADQSAKRMRDEYANISDPEGYVYGSMRVHKELYNDFMDAVDTLATDPENEQAWQAISAFREYQALKHEK